MIYHDSHLHTHFSPDSKENLENIVSSAIQRGLKEICITDHLDFSRESPEQRTLLSLETYLKEILELQDRHKKELSIKVGVEIGLQPHLELDYLKAYPFDFIIGSAHEVGLYDVSESGYWEGLSEAEGYERFFERSLHYFTHFDEHFCIAAHLDYISRYSPRHYPDQEGLKIENYGEQITAILEHLIKKERGIEINTSGFRYNEERVYPHLFVLKRYKELGGKILTIGSDAHQAEHLAMDFETAETVAKRAGFSHYTTFSQQKPEWHSFDERTY